jgi:hypothetical protein
MFEERVDIRRLRAAAARSRTDEATTAGFL